MEFRIAIRGAVVLGLVLVGKIDAMGQTSAQVSGNWSTPATWNNGEPTTSSSAIIDGGFTVTVDSSGPNTNQVDLGSVSGATGNLNITGGDLFVENPGNVPPSAIRVGQAAGAFGNLTMSGGTVFVDGDTADPREFGDGDLLLGDNGTGTMTMTGGAFDVNDELFLGLNPGSSGKLDISGGAIGTLGRSVLVGFGGHGELNLSGTGAVNSNDFTFTSFNPGSTSTINQTGGTFHSNGPIVLARQDDSTYNHSAGAITSGLLIAADNFPADVDNYPQPGSLHAPGAVGTYNISGTATLDLTNIIWLGAWGGGHGIMNQSGGTVNTGAIAVGRDARGTLNMSGGVFNQLGTDPDPGNNNFIVGQNGFRDPLDPTGVNRTEGSGVVNQTGGTINVATNVFLGDYDNSHGVYKISGGTISVTGNFNVGGALAGNAPDDATRVDPTSPTDAQGQALDANGTFIVRGSGSTINVGGNFLANPADKHDLRSDASHTNGNNAATLGFEISSSSGTSLINVAGMADLDGAVIDMGLRLGFVPAVGATFDLLRAASFGSTGTGTTQDVGTGEGFTLAPDDVGSFSLAVVVGGGFETLRATFLALPTGVAGDYNENGVVDAADFTVWRDNLNGASLPNDGGVTPGIVDEEDFNFWKSRFGATSGSGALASGAVPEPTAGLLLVLGTAIGLGRLRRKD